ncbi:MAG: glycosyltransferase family 39 protein [Pseudomonadota bacterium]|nr:glycosyltransferase family 39 protein [Pseudomonadota bacterium]
MTEHRTQSAYWCAALLLVTATTLIRCWFIGSGQVGLSPDEAQYWDWSRTPQWSYYSKGPLIAVINMAGTALLGPTEAGVRAGAVFGSAVMQLAVLGWVGLYMGRIRTAFWTLFALNTTPLFAAGSVLMTTDNPLLTCWIAALICLHLAVDKGWRAAFVLLAVFLAVGITAKYTMLLFIPLALGAGWWIGRKQKLPDGFRPRLGKALAIGGFAGFLPIAAWNAGNGWAGIKHVLYRGGMAGEKARVLFDPENFFEYLGGQLGVITPWWLVFLLLGAWLTGRKIFSGGTGECGLSRSTAIILTVFFWPVWLFFLLWSLHTKIEANWSAAAYPAGMVMAGLAVERFMAGNAGRRRVFVWPALGVLVFLGLHLPGYIPWDGPKNPVHRLLGWEELGSAVAKMQEELGGPAFTLSDEYGVTAELSFYVPGQKRAFCAAGSRKMNQYDFWPGPDAEQTNAVLVIKGRKPTVPDSVRSMFASVGEPVMLTTTQGPRQGQTFLLFPCRGYTGQWPAQEGKTF